jgi:hypothetical protein
MTIAKKRGDMLLPTLRIHREHASSLARTRLRLNDVAGVKKLTAALTILVALAVAGCGLLGSGEAVKQDSGRTVYRAAEAPSDLPDIAPVQQEVPGEKRSRVP